MTYAPRPISKTAQLIHQSIPRFNPIMADGIVMEQFKGLEDYIHQILINSSEHFVEGLAYKGYRRATPEEEVRFLLEKKANSKSSHWTVEMAESTIYLIILEFEFEGETIQHEIYLPYLRRGGVMWIRGTANVLLPVLTATVFSVETMKQHIFLKLLAIKITFMRLNHSVLQDGHAVILPVVHGIIHKHNPKNSAHYETKKDESIKMHHATVIYLFCEYGLSETFRRYAGFVPLVTHGNPDIPEEERKNYTVFSSTRRKPTAVKVKHYEPHDLHMTIPSKYKDDPLVIGMVAGFFYIMDCYSLFALNILELEDPDFWKVILGKTIFKTKDSVPVLLEQINRHMTNVRRMLDSNQIEDLAEAKIDVTEMIGLLAYVIGNFSRMLKETEDGSLYGKRLLVLRNVLEDIIIGVNMLTFQSPTKRAPTSKSVKQDIARRLIPDRILALQNAIFRDIFSSPTDNFQLGISNRMLLQNNISKRGGKRSEITTSNPDLRLHSSVLDIAGYQIIKDTEVTGRYILNPYQAIGRSGITKPNPAFADILKYLGDQVNR